MLQFETHTLESAPEASRTLLHGLKEQAGFVPNLAATMAGSPTLLEAFLGLRSVAARSSLDPVAREVIAIAVVTETGCSYCVAAHSTFALKSGAAAPIVEAVRSGATIADPRLDALARFARAIVRREPDVRDRAQGLLQAGLTADQVLETLVAIAVPMLAGSVFQLAPVTLDPAFTSQAWPRPV